MRLYGHYSDFKAGRYKFEKNLSPKEIIDSIKSGKVFHELVFELSVPEGSTFKSIIEKLKPTPFFQNKESFILKMIRIFLDFLNYQTISVEGFLYPATYRFYNTSLLCIKFLRR